MGQALGKNRAVRLVKSWCGKEACGWNFGMSTECEDICVPCISSLMGIHSGGVYQLSEGQDDPFHGCPSASVLSLSFQCLLNGPMRNAAVVALMKVRHGSIFSWTRMTWFLPLPGASSANQRDRYWAPGMAPLLWSPSKLLRAGR